jgi:hypothetical protein
LCNSNRTGCSARGLRATQRHELTPEIAAAVDFNGRSHDDRRAGTWRGLLRLQVVQIIGRALRVAGCGEDEALVVLQHLKPRRDVGRMVCANLRRDAEIGREEGRTELGDQLFQSIAFVAVAHTAHVTRQALVMLSSCASVAA